MPTKSSSELCGTELNCLPIASDWDERVCSPHASGVPFHTD